MRKMLKRAAAAAVAAVMAVSMLLMSGCSTPKVAVKVDGVEYSTGEYLAFLYNSFTQIYLNQSLYYYDMYSNGQTDVWNETYTYGEGDDAVDYNLADYIRRSAKDSIVRQVAIIRLMSDYGITVSDEDKTAMDNYLASLPNDRFIDYGFSNDSFARMYREYNGNEHTLFYGLYGEGGQKAVPAADIRNYFDQNYLSYKMISYPLTNSNNEEMTDEEKAVVNENLNGYLKMVNDGQSFDDVIAQQKKDDATDDESATDNSQDTNNRKDIDSTQTGDKELVAALKEMAFGDVKIIEYATDNGTKTKALVQRLDPEADRGNDDDGNPVDYFKDQTDTIVYQLKYEEFNTEVNAKVDTLTVDINDRVVKKCDPYEFRSMYVK